MSRLTSVALTTLSFGVATLIAAAPASAQSQADIAHKHNEEGKELMYANRYAEASAKFQEAVARVPEAKYFFNLCTSRFWEGKFGEALTACNAVANNNPPAELQAKTDKLIGDIKSEAQKQGVDVQPIGGGGGDPNACVNPGDPGCQQPPLPEGCDANPQDPACQAPPPPHHGAPPQYAVGRPPSQGVFSRRAADNRYTWTLGADLFGGGGQIGQRDAYGSASGGFRIKSDFMLNPAARFGAQGYLQYTQFGKGEDQSFNVSSLGIIDIGGALYKHLCPRGVERLCLTPLAGLHLAAMSPANMQNEFGETIFNYIGVGARLEMAAQYAFGTRLEHVLSVQLGVNMYTSVLAGPADEPGMAVLSPAAVALDRGGAAGYFGVGYTYRFNTPLGSTPFLVLE